MLRVLNCMPPATTVINWDRHGIGNVPKQIDLDYFGFTRPMTPAEFQALVPAGVSNPRTKNFLGPKVAAGEPVAPPFLLVNWDDELKRWRIYGHEGRSRSCVAPADEPMPVSILPLGIRSRHLTDEMLVAGFVPEPPQHGLVLASA